MIRCRLELLAVPLVVLLTAFASTAIAPPAAGAEAPSPNAPQQDAAAENEAAPAELPPPAELSRQHAAWLESVELLASEAERESFLALRKPYQRDAFIREFWRVRDPYPETARNEFKESWDERVEEARLAYEDAAADDRPRMMLLNGKPARTFQAVCSDLLRPLEVWVYPGTDVIRDPFTLVFYAPAGGLAGPFRLWYPSQGFEILLSLRPSLTGNPQAILRAVDEECPRSQEILGAFSTALDWGRVEDQGSVVPRPNPEWLRTFTAYSTDLPEGADTFDAEVSLSYPGLRQSRTALQGVIGVPLPETSAAAPAAEGHAGEKVAEKERSAARSFVLDGEVLRKGELFEHFRYRFTLRPKDAVAGRWPLVFQRYLRPGEYELVLKLEDLASGAFFREQRPVEVPSEPAPLAGAPASDPGGGVLDGLVPAALAEANATLQTGDAAVRILAPRPGLLTGKQRFEAVALGEGISRVRFELNGQPVLTKTRPPYSAELDLGDDPRFHRLRVAALDSEDETVAADEMMLNGGPHRFAVRLIEPREGEAYIQSVRATAVVEVPEGEVLERVELFLNDRSVASLYQPPYTQPVVLPEGDDTTYIRAVAYLEGGATAEDVVFVNSTDPGETLDVRFVELYTTVTDRRGRPVAGLEQEDFRVLEDGREQGVRRFETVQDRPVWAGILLDTSASMLEELEDATASALSFFETVLTPKDRAAVITFNRRPSLVVRFTSDTDVLARGVEGLTAEGETALYDSLVYALYYFSGINGKRALVLLSDGEDAGSEYEFEDVVEYARRTGVAIYPIGLKLSSRQTEIRLKLQRLARETGGRAFFVEGTSGLPRVYDEIQAEIRAQYLLAYQATAAEDDESFREVKVEMVPDGLEAKTITGYYP